jgi:hypothetical protein
MMMPVRWGSVRATVGMGCASFVGVTPIPRSAPDGLS